MRAIQKLLKQEEFGEVAVTSCVNLCFSTCCVFSSCVLVSAFLFATERCDKLQLFATLDALALAARSHGVIFSITTISDYQ
jgi:hypothetical protein